MITTVFIIVGTGVTANLVGVTATIFLQQPEYSSDIDEEHNIPRSMLVSVSDTNTYANTNTNNPVLQSTQPDPNANPNANANTNATELASQSQSQSEQLNVFDRCGVACRQVFDWCSGYEELALVNGTTVFQASASDHTKDKVSQGLRPVRVSYGGEGSKNNSIAVNRIRRMLRQYHLDMQVCVMCVYICINI